MQKVYQVRIKEMNASEPLMTCRKRINDTKTEGQSLTREEFEGKPAYCSNRVRHESGMNLISGSCMEHGNLHIDVKGIIQVEDPQE